MDSKQQRKKQGSITFRLQPCLSFWQVKEGCEQSSKKYNDQNLLYRVFGNNHFVLCTLGRIGGKSHQPEQLSDTPEIKYEEHHRFALHFLQASKDNKQNEVSSKYLLKKNILRNIHSSSKERASPCCQKHKIPTPHTAEHTTNSQLSRHLALYLGTMQGIQS